MSPWPWRSDMRQIVAAKHILIARRFLGHDGRQVGFDAKNEDMVVTQEKHMGFL